MEKLVNKVLNKSIEGYVCYLHNDSHWIINPTNNRWVIKVSSSGYTFYNYFFFHGIFSYLSLDVIKDKIYIYDWIVNELELFVSDHCHPDYLPGEYNWIKDFEVDLVIERGKIIAVRPDSLRSM